MKINIKKKIILIKFIIIHYLIVNLIVNFMDYLIFITLKHQQQLLLMLTTPICAFKAHQLSPTVILVKGLRQHSQTLLDKSIL